VEAGGAGGWLAAGRGSFFIRRPFHLIPNGFSKLWRMRHKKISKKDGK
jgi:hypothetical protein